MSCTALQTLLAQQARQRKAAQDAAARQVALRAPAKKLALQLLSKGWRVGRPQMSVGECLANFPQPMRLRSDLPVPTACPD